MMLSELFVRVTGDTNDFTTKMGGAQRALGGLQKGAQEAHGGVGRLNNAMAGMAAQIAGVNPVLGKATEIIASLGLGGASVVTGALAGLALLAFAWDTLTKSARAAGKAQDDAIQRLGKAAQLKGAGPGGQTTLDLGEAVSKLQKLTQERKALIDATSNDPLGIAPGQESRLEDLDAEIDAVTKLVGLAKQWKKTAEDDAARQALEKEAARLKKIADELERAKNAANALAQSLAVFDAERERAFQGIFAPKGGPDTIFESMQSRVGRQVDQTLSAMGATAAVGGGFSMPNVNMNDALTDEQKKAREKMGILIDDANKNTLTLRDAVWGAAAASASMIVSALNIGGGGKGSSLGGALGSTAGTIGGMMLGAKLGTIGGAPGMAVGAAIGAVIGTIGGSLFGGLFDSHKKAVDSNTQAVRALTSAMLLYAPAGFRAESYRYSASDPKPLDKFAKYARSTAARGGANPLAERIFG